MLKYKNIDICTFKSATVNEETFKNIVNELAEHIDDILYITVPFVSTRNFNETVPFNFTISYQTIFDTKIRNIRYFGYSYDESFNVTLEKLYSSFRKTRRYLILEGLYNFDFCRLNVPEYDLPAAFLFINIENIFLVNIYNSTIITLHNNFVYSINDDILGVIVDECSKNGWYDIFK